MILMRCFFLLVANRVKLPRMSSTTCGRSMLSAESLSDFVDNLREGYSARTLVVTLNTLEEGVMLRGRLVPALPASVLATLRPAGGSRRGEPYKRVGRTQVELDTVLSGKQELTVLVRDEVR